MTEQELQAIESTVEHNSNCTGINADCYIQLDNDCRALIAEVRRLELGWDMVQCPKCAAVICNPKGGRTYKEITGADK
jgi:hypothetical protein